jgi:hypothetical protein
MPGAYSFQSVSATYSSPTASINLGAGAAVADEGISIEPTEDKNTMTIGADGGGMHSMHAGNPANVSVRLLQTSPVNALLMAEYNAQRANSTLWGQGVFLVRQTASGDTTTATNVAYKRKPNLVYRKDGAFLEWAFEAIEHDTVLGTY